MISAIKNFFQQRIELSAQIAAEEREQRLRIACTALLLEVGRADFDLHGNELRAVADAIQQRFDLSKEGTQELVELGETEARESSSYYEFTSLINKSFNYAEKLALLTLMWEVAYADHHLDKYEEALLRKIADLLYIRHPDYIACKLRVHDQ